MLSTRLKELRTEKHYTQEKLSKLVNVSPKTVGAWERGTRQAPIESVIRLSDLFNVSTDYLIGKSSKRHYYDLTEKDEKNIQVQLQNTIDGLSGNNPLAFLNNGGTEISPEDAELLKASYENILRQSKILAKKKFTPEKYRDGENE